MAKDIIKEALKYYGLKEIPGEKNNPVIMSWAKKLGQYWVQNDETAWCSLAVNAIAASAGYINSVDTEKYPLMARSWLNIGRGVEPFSNAEIGDICIFWRGRKNDGWKGHVGWFISNDKVNINLLGGNQSNMMCIKPYPISKLLGIRRLKSK